MHKKYVHPCYNLNNLTLLQLNDETFVDSTGKIYTMSEINKKLAEDNEKVESGDYMVAYNLYGLLDISEAEFKESVYEVLSKVHEEISSRQIEIKKIQALTGVYL